MNNMEKSAFSSWKYRHYFDFVSVKDDNIKVRCKLCAGDRPLSTYNDVQLKDVQYRPHSFT